MKEYYISNKNGFVTEIKNIIDSSDDTGTKIILIDNRYDVYPNDCAEGFYATTNNNSGIKKTAFVFLEKKNIIFDGKNADIVFHGHIYPFIIQNSKNIQIKNVKIDFTQNLYSYAEIISYDNGEMKLAMKTGGDCSDYYVNENHNLIFNTGEYEVSSADKEFLIGEYNTEFLRDETDTWLSMYKIGRSTKETDNPPVSVIYCDAYDEGQNIVTLRFKDDSKRKPYKVGNGLRIMFEDRKYGNIFVDASCNTIIDNVRIYRGPGMGILSQNCKNLYINGVKILPKDGRSGLVSITADCIHVVNCKGVVKVTNSEFKNSFDDVLNVHGIYAVVYDIISENKFVVKLMHQDQHYINVFSNGERIRSIDKKTGIIMSESFVESSYFSDDGCYITITVKTPLINLEKGQYIENHESMPEVIFENNKIVGISRLLCSVPKAIIASNVFLDCGNPIFITDCPKYWCESGRIDNLTIRNNTFLRCCYKGSRCPVIIRCEYGCNIVDAIHGSVIIESNRTENSDCALAELNNIKNVVIKDNIMLQNRNMKQIDEKQNPYELNNCENAVLKNNIVIW